MLIAQISFSDRRVATVGDGKERASCALFVGAKMRRNR